MTAAIEQTGASAKHNIAAVVDRQADERPHQRAVVFPAGRSDGRAGWSQLTFAQASKLIDEIARGMLAQGVRPGDRVSLLVRPSLTFIPLVFAVFKIGAVPVFVDPGMGRKRALQCIESMQPRVLVAEPLVHLLSPLFGRAFRSVEIRVTAGATTLWWGGKTLEGLRISGGDPVHPVPVHRDDEAAILFTSGSTGPAKGVTTTHGILHTQTQLIQSMFDIEPGEIECACFPLFGLFSMAMGVTVVFPEMDLSAPAKAQASKVVEAIEEHGCTSAMGSPAVWRKVGPYCAQQNKTLDSLRRVLVFGAPIPVALHEQFRGILADGAQLHTPYGATECLPVASIGTDEILSTTHARTREGAGTCVGKPISDALVRIIAIDDEPIATLDDATVLETGRVGEILVKGPMVTPEYKNEPDHTAGAKVRDGSAICHRMGDVGYLDHQGLLWFCGRKSHRIDLGDGRCAFPIQLEGVLNEHPLVQRSAVVGVGGRMVAVVESCWTEQVGEREVKRALDPSTWDELSSELIAAAAKDGFEVGNVLFHPGFPVDVRHNAKIDRPALAAWSQQQMAQS